MELTLTLLGEEDLQAFVRYYAPLATADLARASDPERRERVSQAIAGLGLAIEDKPGVWLAEALALEGPVLLNRVKLATYFLPSSYVYMHRRERLNLSCGSFEVHAWLLASATGCPWIVPRQNEPRSAEFMGTHFRRFSWLTAAELGAVRVVTPFETLRAEARRHGDAPTWPVARVDGYVGSCIQQCEQLMLQVAAGQRAGTACISEVNNTDWDYE